MKWHWGPPASKSQVQDYQNKDRFSVCGILLLQPKPKLGRTKPSTGPHAARGPRVGHSCYRQWGGILYEAEYTCSTIGKQALECNIHEITYFYFNWALIGFSEPVCCTRKWFYLSLKFMVILWQGMK